MYRQNTNFLTPQTPHIFIKYELFPHLLVTLIIMIVTKNIYFRDMSLGITISRGITQNCSEYYILFVLFLLQLHCIHVY